MRKWSELKTRRKKARRALHLVKDVWCRLVSRPARHAWYWIRCHSWTRYHLVDARDPQNGYKWGWIDRDNLMFYACFSILRQFVERENPQIGQAEWVMSDEDDELSDRWLQAGREIRELYEWWTRDRRREHSKCRKILDDVRTLGVPVPKLREQEAWNRWVAESERLEARDDEMFDRLMKVRGFLWT